MVGAACQAGTAVLAGGRARPNGQGQHELFAGRERTRAVRACSSAAAVLGDSTAGCVSGALAGVTRPQSASRNRGRRRPATGVIQRAVAPVTSVLGLNAPAGTGSFTSGPLAGLQQMSGLAPLATAPAPRGLTGDNTSSIFGNTPGAGGTGDTNVPAASQLAGLEALPGLADLPSLAGLANTPAPDGVSGGGIPMPGPRCPWRIPQV